MFGKKKYSVSALMEQEQQQPQQQILNPLLSCSRELSDVVPGQRLFGECLASQKYVNTLPLHSSAQCNVGVIAQTIDNEAHQRIPCLGSEHSQQVRSDFSYPPTQPQHSDLSHDRLVPILSTPEGSQSISDTESNKSKQRQYQVCDEYCATGENTNRFFQNCMDEALLHHTCRLFPRSAFVIQSALRFDLASIRLAKPVDENSSALKLFPKINKLNEGSHNSTKSGSSILPNKQLRGRFETYKYPINIAIMHGASAEVVQILAQNSPDVLLFPDGPEECGSLSIFFSKIRIRNTDTTTEENSKIVRALLRTNRQCATVLDRRRNSTLHYAVLATRHLPLETLSLVHAAHPTALKQRNFHGLTPLDVAVQSSSLVPMAVVDFLDNMSHSKMEEDSMEALNQCDQDLDRSLQQQEYERERQEGFTPRDLPRKKI